MGRASVDLGGRRIIRSEEHTSELQSHDNLVCRLLLGKTTLVQLFDGQGVQAPRARASTLLRRPPLDDGTVDTGELELCLHHFFFKGAAAPEDRLFSPPGCFPG